MKKTNIILLILLGLAVAVPIAWAVNTQVSWVRFNNSGEKPTFTGDQVLVGGTSTTSLATFEAQALSAAGGSLLVNGSTTLQKFTFTIATGTAATTTDFAVTNTINGSVSGNAGTATKLQTARNINNVSFDGTASITITAASSTLLSDNNSFTGGNIFVNTTTTSATTTNLFATTASSTNSFVGTKLGIASSTPAYALSVGNTNSIVVNENKVATSTSQTIDWSKGNQQLMQIGTSAITITMSNYLQGAKELVVVCNPASGTAGALTWSGVEWVGGTAPTQTTTANQCDAWSFIATQATSTTGALKIFGTAATGFN